MAMARATYALAFLVLFCVVGMSKAQLSHECDALTDPLLSCIEFVNDTSTTAPTTPCCEAVDAIQAAHPECICQLVQTFADPSTATQAAIALGVPTFSSTRALEVPALCRVTIDFNNCPHILESSSTSTPTPSPISTPTPSPISTPTPSLVSTPTPLPVSTPTPSPVSTPTPSPASTPTPSPISTPTPSPISTPKPSPISIPRDAPTSEPVPTIH